MPLIADNLHAQNPIVSDSLERLDPKLLVVVAADRPVSAIQNGMELTSQCRIEPLSSRIQTPPSLSDWLAASPNNHSRNPG